MALRLDMPRLGDRRRWTAGLRVSSQCTQVAAALIAATGRGLEARIDVVHAVTADVPHETAGVFTQLAAGNACPVAALALFRSALAEVEAAAVNDLLAASGVAPDHLLAVGVHDPGLWRASRTGPNGYLGLCDAARLAETTGLNVIDAFPARDVAQGGQGGPITALAEWVVLKSSHSARVLLDLGRTVRITYLPATAIDHAAARLLSFEVGPGTSLLDSLTHRLTGGQHRFDSGGRMAVQGRRIPELIAHWLADPYFEGPLPRWHPRGVPPERFLADSLRMAVESNWSVRDLLCSATHFLAESVAAALRKRLPEDAAIAEVLITGGGQHNGMLLHEIGHLTGLPLVRLAEVNIPPDGLEAAAVATLALLHLDQVPANPTSVTQAEIPRLLGRLTPGSPQSWQRLLQASGGGNSHVRPLRAAL